MRISARAIIVLVTALLSTTPALALEKTRLAIAEDEAMDVWTVGASCPIRYYNNCTGWLWVWGDGEMNRNWRDKDVVGIVYDPCCGSATLEQTTTYVWSGELSPGYGFTGTIDVSSANASGCPSVLLAQQPFFPSTGFTVNTWGVPLSGPVVVTLSLAATMLPSRLELASDRPAGGPTGPTSLGFCYPSTREAHSFYYGNNATNRNCPGLPLFDGVANAEWLFWGASFSCATGVAGGTEFRRWGAIKSLYR